VVDIAPAQERVLHDVLGLGDRAEHAIGEAYEELAVCVERHRAIDHDVKTRNRPFV
jgi:hypothetical protein